ncbi:S-layer homology domain-containing protein [Effusibacillus pohliae]|uniref:S-layer homology domain-containing protein n=1 Tax=Effusibacillus pohliae TaxID=232270 RepID=UPI00036FA133|nr:S-layer homology domain-containing protein [Effusibacillus pohliae]
MGIKRSLYVFSLSALLAGATIQGSFAGSVYAADFRQTVGTFPAGTQGVITDTVNFRSGPGTSYSVLSVLQPGMAVNVLSRNEQNWYQIQVGNQTGWVFGDYIAPKTPDDPNIFRITPYPAEPNFYEVRDGALYHVIGTPEARSASFYVGPAPAMLQPGNVYVRDANYQFYRRAADGDLLVGSYTPPYLTLDLRLPTRVQAADIDNFIRSVRPSSPLIGKGQAFLDAQAKYGVNAHYLAAHAILESDYGESMIAKDKNNIFGYMAYDSDPYGSAAYFASIEDCINFVAYFVATQYLSPTGTWYEGSTLAGMNKHYATDPYWSEKIAGIMARIRPYNANDYQGVSILPVTAPKPPGPIPAPVNTTLTETYPQGTTAVVTEDVNFRTLPSTSAGKYGVLPQGTTLNVLGKGIGNWYKVQSGSQTGWVYGDYIKLVEPGDPLPSRGGMPGGNQPLFADIPADRWSKPFIEALVNKKIVSGYPDGTFKPTQNITREQSAKLLVKALQLNTGNRPAPNVTDLDPNSIYYQDIVTVLAEGIFSGYDGKFHPGESLTRGQMASILVKAFRLQGTGSDKFNDVKGHWAANAIGILAANGIASGYGDGTFRPDNPITREEFAAILSKLVK